MPVLDSRDRVARTGLKDRSSKVQLAVLNYVDSQGRPWPDAREVLIGFLGSRSLSVSAAALTSLGEDGLAIVRGRLLDPAPSPMTAVLLGRYGDETDCEGLMKVAAAPPPAKALPFIAAAARLQDEGALVILVELATKGADLDLARRASKAIWQAARAPSFDAISQAADQGPAFPQRGLVRFLYQLPALKFLEILCRLERSGTGFDGRRAFEYLGKKINSGLFAPKEDDWSTLDSLLPQCSAAQGLAGHFFFDRFRTLGRTTGSK